MFKQIYNKIKSFLSGYFDELKYMVITDLKDEKPIRRIFYTPLLALFAVILTIAIIVFQPIKLILKIKEAIQLHLPREQFQITYLNIKEELNNFLSAQYVVYIENDYNSTINKYIAKNYEKIKDVFWKRQELQFVYVPKIIDKLYSNLEEIVCYYSPTMMNKNQGII